MTRDELMLAALDWTQIASVAQLKARELEAHGAPASVVADAEGVSRHALRIYERLVELASLAAPMPRRD